MSGNRGCLANSALFLIIVGLPVVGHIVATVMLLEDDHSFVGKLLWLLIIWLTPPFVVVGPLLYLLFGQRASRRGRVTFGQNANQQQMYYQPMR